LVPTGNVPTPSYIKSEVDLAPHTCLNIAMKLKVIYTLWMHAHLVLSLHTLAGSLSKVLLLWLIEKEVELML
jgi:hypothetical protein